MSQIQQIAEGWKNTIFRKEDVELLAKARLEICASCEFHSKNIQDKALIRRPDDHCTKCGCPLISKTRCVSCSCPIEKWVGQKEDENASKEG